jgi:undecaprenyl-diphosphatase
MNFIEAAILGVVEGITEFLPISSTGHLILTSYLLGLDETDFVKTFQVVIQLGAILAVVALYWRRVLLGDKNLLKKLLVALLPAVAVGFGAYSFIKDVLFESQIVVLWALFLGGVFIFVFEKWHGNKEGVSNLENMTYKQALGIGLAQSVAVIPGVSRAAATIMGGLFAGLDRKSIVEFSFLLAIPTMAGATILDLSQTASVITGAEYSVLAVGFVVSFVVAWLAVKWLLKYIQTHNFIAFGIYRIALAFIFWLLLF